MDYQKSRTNNLKSWSGQDFMHFWHQFFIDFPVGIMASEANDEGERILQKMLPEDAHKKLNVIL